jgi:hypothetical protein
MVSFEGRRGTGHEDRNLLGALLFSGWRLMALTSGMLAVWSGLFEHDDVRSRRDRRIGH